LRPDKNCSFSNRVSSDDPVTCTNVRCLTRCHLVFVSNLCHFFRTPLSIPWRHIQSLRVALAGYAEAEVDEITFLLPTQPEPETLRDLDELADLASSVS